MTLIPTPHRIELELTTAPPRRVRFTATTQTRRLRAWALTLLPLFAVMAYGLHATEVDGALLTRGITTNARVTSMAVVDSGRSSNTDAVNEKSIMFEFRANGDLLVGRGIDDNSYPRSLRVGDSVPVTYLPENPRSFVQGRVASWQVVQKDEDWIISSAVLALAGFTYIFVVERFFWRQWRLLRFGKVAAATVLSRHTAESGETAAVYVRYEYPNFLGNKVSGQFPVSPKRSADFADGARFSVLCMPDSNEPGTPYALIADAEIVKPE